MKERMQNAKKEIAYAQGQGRYEYIVVNDDFNIALHELTNIFITEIDRTEALSIKK
jgi:guanylate kinase